MRVLLELDGARGIDPDLGRNERFEPSHREEEQDREEHDHRGQQIPVAPRGFDSGDEHPAVARELILLAGFERRDHRADRVRGLLARSAFLRRHRLVRRAPLLFDRCSRECRAPGDERDQAFDERQRIGVVAQPVAQAREQRRNVAARAFIDLEIG